LYSGIGISFFNSGHSYIINVEVADDINWVLVLRGVLLASIDKSGLVIFVIVSVNKLFFVDVSPTGITMQDNTIAVAIVR
jgi:hypothetical protein